MKPLAERVSGHIEYLIGTHHWHPESEPVVELHGIAAELERLAGEMRDQYASRKLEHPNWRDDFAPKWADQLAERKVPK